MSHHQHDSMSCEELLLLLLLLSLFLYPLASTHLCMFAKSRSIKFIWFVFLILLFFLKKFCDKDG